MSIRRSSLRHGALAKLLEAVSLIGISLPTFLIGVLLIYLFAVVLGWLPSFGRGDVVRLGPWWTTGLLTVSGLKAIIIAFDNALALFQMTLIMRLMVRASNRDARGAGAPTISASRAPVGFRRAPFISVTP